MSIIKDKQQRQYVQHNLRTHLTVIKGNAEVGFELRRRNLL